MERVIADMSAADLAFSVYVGDLSSPRYGCSDEIRRRRLTQFNGMTHPVVYTPGDNEWTDCHSNPNIAKGDPLERLDDLRVKFFTGEMSLGQRKIPLLRQSASSKEFSKYRENARWEMGGVTLITLHVVGSNNGLGRNPAGDTEAAERNAANLAWMRDGFAQARAANSRALMIVQQANIFPDLPPFPGDPAAKPDGFAELREALRKEVAAFEKPVLLVHGDSHYFRIDKPFAQRPLQGATGHLLENFTRVETFGDPMNHWVQAFVEAGNPTVFTFRERIVPANVERSGSRR